MPNQNNAGKWRLSYVGEALVISSGLVYTSLTRPKGLDLAIILAMIEEHPRRQYYETKAKRRLTLGDSLAQDRLKDIGKEIDFSVSLSLISPLHDRDFQKLPQTGGQLLQNKYRSMPKRV